ncbi:MAG: endospore germination permease [Clostridia bacterium]|nr:endospore germination permease [Clostridia bacterium]
MNKTITPRQFAALVACYIQGSLLSMMYYYQRSGHDAWLTVLVGGVLFLPLIFLYCRMLGLSNGMGLSGMLSYGFGKIAGKVILLAYLVYFIYLAAFSLRQSAQFINIDILIEVPILVPIVLMGLVCWYGSSKGVSFFAFAAPVLCVGLYVLLLFLTAFLFPRIQLRFLFPVFRRSWEDSILPVLIPFTMPFGELVCMTVFMGRVRISETDKYPLWKSFLTGFILGFFFVLMVLLRDILVLGPFASILSYPAYEVIRFASIGSVITRIESVFNLPFLFILFFRISIQLWCSIELMKEIFAKTSEKRLRWITALLVTVSAYIFASSNVALLNKAITWIPLFFLIPQVGIPVCMLVGGLIRKRLG